MQLNVVNSSEQNQACHLYPYMQVSMCPYVSRSAVRNLGTVTFLPENIQQGNKYKKECEFVLRVKHVGASDGEGRGDKSTTEEPAAPDRK